MGLGGDTLVYGVWLAVAAVLPEARPEAVYKAAVDDWIDLIFFVFGLGVAGLFVYVLSRLIRQRKGNDPTGV